MGGSLPLNGNSTNSGSGGGSGGSNSGKMPSIIRDFLSSLDDEEWKNELYKLLQGQSFNQVEVDLFELLCKVLDQNLFAQVDWARNSFYFRELEVNDQMRLLESSWSEMLIMDQIHQRMHNQLPDETTLANGQKFELLSLALLGVPSMSEAFNDLTTKLSTLKFDSADYVCLKFVLLLNPDVRTLRNRSHVQECHEQVKRTLQEYCFNCYPSVPDKFNQLLSLLPDLREMAQRERTSFISSTCKATPLTTLFSWKCYLPRGMMCRGPANTNLVVLCGCKGTALFMSPPMTDCGEIE